MFEHSRIRLNKWFLKRQLQKRKLLRSSISLAEARSIGILVNATTDDQLQAALSLADRLKKQKKKVEVLAFTGKAKPSDSSSKYQVFGTKELDWAFRPKADAVKAFMEQPFDILFYHSHKGEPVLDYIMALSRARFRVGPYSDSSSVCDLMVVPQKADARAFADLMLFYLEKLNPKQPSLNHGTAPANAIAS